MLESVAAHTCGGSQFRALARNSSCVAVAIVSQTRTSTAGSEPRGKPSTFRHDWLQRHMITLQTWWSGVEPPTFRFSGRPSCQLLSREHGPGASEQPPRTATCRRGCCHRCCHKDPQLRRWRAGRDQAGWMRVSYTSRAARRTRGLPRIPGSSGTGRARSWAACTLLGSETRSLVRRGL
jgi:hypothetical protein